MIKLNDSMKYNISYFKAQQTEFLNFMRSEGVEGTQLPWGKFNEIIAGMAFNDLGFKEKVESINPHKYGDDGVLVGGGICEIKNITIDRTSVDFTGITLKKAIEYKTKPILIIICKMDLREPVEIIYGYSNLPNGIGQFLEDTHKRQKKEKVGRLGIVTVTLSQCFSFGLKSRMVGQSDTNKFWKSKKSLTKVLEVA